MKITVFNNITSQCSKNFEKKVAKLLPTGVNEIVIYSCGMTWEGRGSYNYFLDITINSGQVWTLKQRTTDSTSYDDYNDLEHGSRKLDNWKKNVCLMLLEDYEDSIIEFLNEESDESEDF